MSNINPLNLALSGGITWAISILLFNMSVGLFGRGVQVQHLLETVYPGYSSTITGTLIGMAWSFVDGFVVVLLYGLIYNGLQLVTHSKGSQHQ